MFSTAVIPFERVSKWELDDPNSVTVPEADPVHHAWVSVIDYRVKNLGWFGDKKAPKCFGYVPWQPYSIKSCLNPKKPSELSIAGGISGLGFRVPLPLVPASWQGVLGLQCELGPNSHQPFLQKLYL
jgi:hypothetical protein